MRPQPLGFGAKERTRGQERGSSGLFSFGARNGTCTKGFGTDDNTPILQGIQRETKKEAFLFLFWCTELAWAGCDGGCRQPIVKRTVLGIKKEGQTVFFFGARNRTSSIIRYFTLLADIVCINPFRNKPDMTTMTNNSSKIWPNHDQPIHNLIFHIPQQFFCCQLHLEKGKPAFAEVILCGGKGVR